MTCIICGHPLPEPCPKCGRPTTRHDVPGITPSGGPDNRVYRPHDSSCRCPICVTRIGVSYPVADPMNAEHDLYADYVCSERDAGRAPIRFNQWLSVRAFAQKGEIGS